MPPLILTYLVSILPFPQVFLDCPNLTESSGVCTTHDGTVVWTHNDSGGQPKLYAFERDGRLLCEVLISGAAARDWEDICTVRQDAQEWIAIGDVGDNLRRRSNVQVYLIPVPRLQDLRASPQRTLTASARINVTFPGGPFDCESLAYDASEHRIVLATKEYFRCRLFSIPLDQVLPPDRSIARNDTRPPTQQLPQVSYSATYHQTLAYPMVTGADITRDGSQLVLTTYAAGLLLHRSDDEPHRWNNAAVGPKQMVALDFPTRKQGESVCFTDNDETLLLTSEHTPTPLIEFPLQPAKRSPVD